MLDRMQGNNQLYMLLTVGMPIYLSNLIEVAAKLISFYYQSLFFGNAFFEAIVVELYIDVFQWFSQYLSY